MHYHKESQALAASQGLIAWGGNPYPLLTPLVDRASMRCILPASLSRIPRFIHWSLYNEHL